MICADIILVIKYLCVYSELQAQTQVEKAHRAFYGRGVMITPSCNHIFSSSCDTEASTLNIYGGVFIQKRRQRKDVTDLPERSSSWELNLGGCCRKVTSLMSLFISILVVNDFHCL